MPLGKNRGNGLPPLQQIHVLYAALPLFVPNNQERHGFNQRIQIMRHGYNPRSHKMHLQGCQLCYVLTPCANADL